MTSTYLGMIRTVLFYDSVFAINGSLDGALVGSPVLLFTIVQFFKHKSSRASQQICRPGAEQADKFMF
jgi:predicted membrane protein